MNRSLTSSPSSLVVIVPITIACQSENGGEMQLLCRIRCSKQGTRFRCLVSQYFEFNNSALLPVYPLNCFHHILKSFKTKKKYKHVFGSGGDSVIAFFGSLQRTGNHYEGQTEAINASIFLGMYLSLHTYVSPQRFVILVKRNIFYHLRIGITKVIILIYTL